MHSLLPIIRSHKIYFIIIVAGLLFISAKSYAQNKHNKPISNFANRHEKLIIGRWMSKDSIMWIFTKNLLYVFYEKDTLEIDHYVIADSCSNDYEGCINSPLYKSYLLIHGYDYPNEPSDSGDLECCPIINLNDSEIVVMNFDGSISQFNRIK